MITRPITFMAESVLAILEGRKTQTRRLISDPWNQIQLIGGMGDDRDDPDNWGYFGESGDFSGWCVLARGVNERGINGNDRASIRCPYEVDRLWVRETWRTVGWDEDSANIQYRADGVRRWIPTLGSDPDQWIEQESARYEKRGAVERDGMLHLPEGIEAEWRSPLFLWKWASRIELEVTKVRCERLQKISKEDALAEGVNPQSIIHPRDQYADVWVKLHGEASWREDPFVWVVEFKRRIA